MGVHDGHRQRLRERFLRDGLGGFEEHVALELLLFNCIPRGDTNALAHTLLERFGSLAGVLDAPFDQLLAVSGVGENTACLLKLIPQLSRRYMISRTAAGEVIDSTDRAGELLVPRYFGETDEVVYLICLDGKNKLLDCSLIFRGAVDRVDVNMRKIVERAIACNATAVILSHNHPSGVAIPSYDDRVVTQNVKRALDTVGIALRDHIIVADGDYVSILDSGMMVE